jgi:hypothetical protein
VQSFGNLAASTIAGLLWTAVSPQVAFGYLVAWMLLAPWHSRVLRPWRSPVTCGTCGLHSAQARVVRDHLE